MNLTSSSENYGIRTMEIVIIISIHNKSQLIIHLTNVTTLSDPGIPTGRIRFPWTSPIYLSASRKF